MIYSLVLPAGLVQSQKGVKLITGLLLGDPFYEREGVPNRRAAFIHNYSPDEIMELNQFTSGRQGFGVFEGLPSDWRYYVPTWAEQ